MPVGLGSSLEVLLFDFQRLGIALYGVVILGFIVAFTVSGLIAKYTRLGGKYLYSASWRFCYWLGYVLNG